MPQIWHDKPQNRSAGCASGKIFTGEPNLCRLGRRQNHHWGTDNQVNNNFQKSKISGNVEYRSLYHIDPYGILKKEQQSYKLIIKNVIRYIVIFIWYV